MDEQYAGGAGGARTHDPGIMDPNVLLTRIYMARLLHAVCNKDAFKVDFWPFLAIPPPLSGPSPTTDPVYLSGLKVASDKVGR